MNHIEIRVDIVGIADLFHSFLIIPDDFVLGIEAVDSLQFVE